MKQSDNAHAFSCHLSNTLSSPLQWWRWPGHSAGLSTRWLGHACPCSWNVFDHFLWLVSCWLILLGLSLNVSLSSLHPVDSWEYIHDLLWSPRPISCHSPRITACVIAPLIMLWAPSRAEPLLVTGLTMEPSLGPRLCTVTIYLLSYPHPRAYHQVPHPVNSPYSSRNEMNSNICCYCCCFNHWNRASH